METSNNEAIVESNFINKYLQIFPKGRIGRLKYLGRLSLLFIFFLLVFFILGIAWYFVDLLFGAAKTKYFDFFRIFGCQVLAVLMLWTIGQKRINDIGKHTQITKSIHSLIILFWFIILSWDVLLPPFYRGLQPVHYFIFPSPFLLHLSICISILFILSIGIIPGKRQSSEIIK